MKSKLFNNLIVFSFSFVASSAVAQMGGIRGTVMDQDFEVPLPGVKVLISETGQEIATGDTGSYYLEQIKPGAYTLMFSKAGYTRFTKPQVVVSAGQLSEVDAALAGEYEEMDELVVKEISLGGASEIGLLNLRMENSALMDSVGADLMSKAGASDAAGALKLVSGTTVQDGKYAVVRGLPDRYVVSMLNGVRLPTSDPDKRAVQLDQYPSSLIESVQVLKSFTPDQQGDASGGTVDIVLRGVPDERVVKVSVGTKYNENYAGDEFLSYDTSDNNYWGRRDFEPLGDLVNTNQSGGNEYDDPIGQSFSGSKGVSTTDQPINYKWGIELGDRYTFDLFGEDVSVGGLAVIGYEQEALQRTGTEDYYTEDGSGRLIAEGSVADIDSLAYGDEVLSELWDVTEGKYEISWNGAVGIGLEHELLKLHYLYVFTHNTEDTAALFTDTRGRETYNSEYTDYVDSSTDYLEQLSKYYVPYRKQEALIYTERDTDSGQLSGELTIPIPDLDLKLFQFKRPVFDFKLSQSSSSMWKQKSVLDYYWIPGESIWETDAEFDWEEGIDLDAYSIATLGNFIEGAAWMNPFTNSAGVVYTPSAVSDSFKEDYAAYKSYIESHPELGLVFPEYAWYNGNIYQAGSSPSEMTGVESNGTYNAVAAGEQLGNYQLIWQEVIEESDQAAFNYRWDFGNWTENEGYFKAGLFSDEVERKYFQQTLSNKYPSETLDADFEGNWEDNLGDLFEAHADSDLYASFADVNYDGEQHIDAYYLMTDFPVFEFLSVKGGVRHEEFSIKTYLEPDNYSYARTITSSGGLGFLTKDGDGYKEDADFTSVDNLPSFGLDLTPLDQFAFRFNWAQTKARQQFKEVVPIIQSEYAGGDAFYGNPNLVSSSLDNLDLRFDYMPYPGGLVSVSYFAKDIEEPIQYYKGSDGYANSYTFVTNFPTAWVEGYEFEVRQQLGQFFDSLEGVSLGGNYTYIRGEVDLGDGSVSDVMEMPEYLLNMFCTYDLNFNDTKLGLFYTHKGDTLKTVENKTGTPTPATYALPYGQLNFSVSTKLGEHLKLSFKAKNLMDPDIQTVWRTDTDEAPYESHKNGREYSIGLTALW